MTVLMTLRVLADGTKLTQYAQAHQDELQGIIAKAKRRGVISHRFYASSDEVLVVDEWPDEASFQTFFAESPEIQNMMTASAARAEPVVTFWNKLDTGDEV
jgi:heme-degrading monooxygenase HmoA